MRNDVAKYNPVQKKTSFRHCFSNTEAPNHIDRQAAGILLLASGKKKQGKCALIFSSEFILDLVIIPN